MRTCKVRPSAGECSACADTADFFGQLPDCQECQYGTRYELVGFTSGIFQDYAFVQEKGKIKKVSLDRVYDIQVYDAHDLKLQEEHNENT